MTYLRVDLGGPVLARRLGTDTTCKPLASSDDAYP